MSKDILLTKLFRHEADSICVAEKIRPLGDISHFVCEKMQAYSPFIFDKSGFAAEMPQILEVMEVMVDEVKSKSMAGAVKALSEDEKKIALIDIKMLHAFCSTAGACSKNEHGSLYLQKIEGLRKGLASVLQDELQHANMPEVYHLTYEDVILNNPVKDIRVFMPGDIGKSEAAFYIGHQFIEEELKDVIRGLKSVQAADEAVDVKQTLEAVKCKMQAVRDNMGAYVKCLANDDFNAFRPFFSSNEFTGESGPSGAFSAKVVHLDVLMFGEDQSNDRLGYLQSNKKYFPPEDFAAIMQSRKNNPDGIFELIKKQNLGADVYHVAEEIAQTMVGFRCAHKGAVEEKLPDVMIGTAGENINKFLDGRIVDTKENLKTAKSRCPFGFKS